MIGPVALYPDTLLMQILVATTVPLDVMKAKLYRLGGCASSAKIRANTPMRDQRTKRL